MVPINSVRKFLLLNKIFEIQTWPIAKANWYFSVMIIKNNNYEMSVIIKIFFFLYLSKNNLLFWEYIDLILPPHMIISLIN